MATTVTTARESPCLGPEDHGRVMSLTAFEESREKPGYVYELIDGAVHVSPLAKPPHDRWVWFLHEVLLGYRASCPQAIQAVRERCEVVIPGRSGVSRPQPDLAVYKSFPSHQATPGDWDVLIPCVVVEVISRRRAKKDTTRNRHLYWAVAGIQEYWILDPRRDPERPVLLALRRERQRDGWVERKVAFGTPYETPTLPGLVVNLADATR